MRDVLKKLILDSEIICKTCGESTDSYCAEAIADLFLANGGVVMPCKVGDAVYTFEAGKVKEHTVAKIELCSEGKIYLAFRWRGGGYELVAAEDVGKRVFLTREEAEQALRKGR